MFKEYYRLTKPGIVYGNAIAVIGGFALATMKIVGGFGPATIPLFLATLFGISFVIASGCVFNNYIDRDIDAVMGRTRSRALVAHRISNRAAVIYGIILGILGFLTLLFLANALAVTIALFGFFFYVVVYSLWSKLNTVHGTVLGSISGAVPPVVGYCAVSGRLDAGALIIFLIMVLWQMPHFYAIAIWRAEEYAAAGVPVLPAVYGLRATKRQMFLYILAFAIVVPLLTLFGYEGVVYFGIAAVLALAWLAFAAKGFSLSDANGAVVRGHAGFSEANIRWAKQMFFLSLIVMVVLFGALTVLAIV